MQTLVFDPLAHGTYGGSDFDLGATTSSGLEIAYSSSDTSVASVNGNTLSMFGVGSTTITASQPGDGNYEAATSVEQVLTINQKTLTVTAENKSRPYGVVNPALTTKITGFANSENTTALIKIPEP